MQRRRESQGVPAADWESLFRKAGVAVDKLDSAKSARSKTTTIGRVLANHVGRRVPIEVADRTGTARLCARNGRSNAKCYHFEVCWDGCAQDRDSSATCKAAEDDPTDDRSSAGETGELDVPGAEISDGVTGACEYPPELAPLDAASGNSEAW
jgi:hypothetical protein